MFEILDGGFGGADNWAFRIGDAGAGVLGGPDAGLSRAVLSGAGLILLIVRCCTGSTFTGVVLTAGIGAVLVPTAVWLG